MAGTKFTATASSPSDLAHAAERAMKAGDYLNPLVTKFLNELGHEIRQERGRLAQELWELRGEWPHRLELRAAAAAWLANLATAVLNVDRCRFQRLLASCADATDRCRLQRLLACADAADLAEVLIPSVEEANFA